MEAKSRIRFVYLVLFVSVACNLWQWVSHGWDSWELGSAVEQVQVFDNMRAQAKESDDPAQIASYLGYTQRYYPSGSKHAKGNRCDYIVEYSRDRTIEGIIARLRLLTGRDLGDSAQPWIDQYEPTVDAVLKQTQGIDVQLEPSAP